MAAGAAAAGTALVGLALTADKERAKLARATGATGEELVKQFDSVTDVLAEVPQDIETVTASFGTLRTFVTGSNDEIERLTEDLLDFTRLAGGDASTNSELLGQVMNNWGLEATAMNMDTLAKVTQDFGIDGGALLQTLKELGGPLSELGLSADESAVLVGKLHKQGVDMNRAGRTMATWLGDAAEKGMTADQALNGLVNQVRNGSDQQAAYNRVLKAFGDREGPKVFKLIQQGQLDFAGLTEFVEGSSGALTQMNADGTTTGEKIAEMTNKAKAALADVLLPVLDSTVTWFMDVLEWVKRNEETFRNIGAVITVVGEILAKVGEVIIRDFIGRATALYDLFKNIGLFFKNVFTGQWGEAWESIKNVFSSIWELIKSPLQAFLDTFGLDWSDLWEGIKATFRRVWDGIVDLAKGYVNTVIGQFEKMVNYIIRAWNALDIAIGPYEFPSWVPLVGGKGIHIPDLIPDIPEVSLPRAGPRRGGDIPDRGDDR